MAVAVTSENR